MKNQLDNLLREVKELRNKEKLLIECFEKSAGELSKPLHYIVQASLDGRRNCCLTTETCTTQAVERLREMDFEVEEKINCLNKLCGYKISW
jgi:hypothetical protein